MRRPIWSAGRVAGTRRHEVQELALDPVGRAPDPRVAGPVPALGVLQVSLDGMPRGAPEPPGRLVPQHDGDVALGVLVVEILDERGALR